MGEERKKMIKEKEKIEKAAEEKKREIDDLQKRKQENGCLGYL